MTIETRSLSVLPDFALMPPRLRGLSNSAGIDALYVHVPFCSTKCHYCDFYSIAGHLDESSAYLDALECEITISTDLLGKPTPQTIFIGGGTPTLLSPEHLQRLLQLITKAINTSRLKEFTIEANPNTFDQTKANILKDLGVN